MEYRDKICLITGASSGIGKAAAEIFAGAGCELILVVRNRHRGQKAVEDIIRNSGNINIRLFITDLSSSAEIKQLSEKLHSIYNRVDILLNNAGAYFSKFHLTVDGIEAAFDVNYVSRFLLTNMLLDLIMRSDSGRIINVTGEYHRKGEMNFKVKGNGDYSPLKAVSRAKLADMLFSMELSRRMQDTQVKVNTIHPGIVGTNIIYNDPDASLYSKIMYSLLKPFFRDPFKAGKDIFHLAFSDEVKDLNGKYFCCRKMREPSPLVHDRELSSRLWEFTEELTGYVSPIFTKNKIIIGKTK
jgi:NAD(P)-dependent dehydrogenase (short-subunit alcohol dehydrogenase family)